MNEDFVAFILTHGRPNSVFTYKTLIKSGYSGRIIFVIDDEDKTVDGYIKNFGKENIYIFNKEDVSITFDEGDNIRDRRTIVYARNACFNIASELGYKYFIQLDDDYTAFDFSADGNKNYIAHKKIKNLDKIFNLLLNFYKNTEIKSISLAQGGDFIGGENSSVFKKKLSRKCMNSFICSVERPFKFIGRINEDVNTYTNLASRGFLFFTLSTVRLEQKATQSNAGGMTDIYMDSGTYIKSFFSVMFSPSSVKVGLMGNTNMRLHHKVNWKNAVPCIIRQEHKK